MTVREAFSLAFGPVPDGATCHVGYWEGQGAGPVDHQVPSATIANCPPGTRVGDGGAWLSRGKDFGGIGPDISDRQAEAFLGFFGEAYDRVVNGSKEQL